MVEVRASDLRAVLAAAEELAEVEDPDELRRHAAGALRTLVPCDSVQWAEGNGDSRWTVDLMDPQEAQMSSELELECRPYRHQHPVAMHRSRFSDGSPRKLSDFLSSSALHRLELYNLCYPECGVEHQLSVGIDLSEDWRVVAACNRDKGQDFSERDRSMLALLQPHILAAYRRARRRHAIAGLGGDLTERETEILAWVAGGGTNAEIGEALFISPQTVKKHL